MKIKEGPSLEFRIPISPNEKYMRMLHYFVESLRLNGGTIARNSHCVAFVGADVEPWDLSTQYPWTRDYSLKFVWIDRELFRKDRYDATGYERFRIKSDADIIAMVDVDILFTGNIDRAIVESYEEQCVSGFIAHVSPFSTPEFSYVSSTKMWNKLFAAAGLGPPTLEFEHTGWGLMSTDPEHRYCPAYFNYGVIIAPRLVVEQMGKTFTEDIRVVEKVINTWFKSQLANTITLYKNKIPYKSLSINYNFPLHVPEQKIKELNRDSIGENAPSDIKIFHYLGNGLFNKEDFSTQQNLEKALNKSNLGECAQFFQEQLNKIHEKIQIKYYNPIQNNTNKYSQQKNSLHIICGVRRSGTTLLNAILNSNSAANELGQEGQILTRLLEVYQWNKNNFQHFGSSFFEDKASLREYYRDSLMDLVKRMTSFATKNGVLVLKNPELSMVIEEALDIFPKAKLYAIVRDPRDQVCSEFEVAKRRKKDGIISQVFEQRKVEDLAKNYNKYASNILKLAEQDPNKILIIKYEDLTTNPDAVLQQLEKYSGLKLEFQHREEWRKISDKASLHQGYSQSDLYGQPISNCSIGRYTKELSRDEIVRIEKTCDKVMNKFRYTNAPHM